MQFFFKSSELWEETCWLILFQGVLGVGVALKLIFSRLGVEFLYFPSILFLGVLTGFLLTLSEVTASWASVVSTIDPNLWISAFFPLIIFHTAFSMDYHGFGQSTSQILISSFVNYICVVGGLLIQVKFALNLPDNWHLEEAVMYSIMCGIVDAEAVMVALGKTQARVKHLQLLLQGEVLTTLAIATLIYTILFEHFYGSHTSTFPLLVMLWHLLGAFLGTVLGFLIGYVFIYLSSDIPTAVAITTLSAYVSFYLGHVWMNQSGVVFTIMCGVMLSPTKIRTSSDVEVQVTNFWDMLSFTFNTVSYAIPAVTVGINTEHLTLSSVAYSIVVYLIILMCRVIANLFSRVLHGCIGHPLPWSHLVIVIVGPHTSPTALLFAITFRHYSPNGHKILTFVVILCLLSAIINGIALPILMKNLGMYELSQTRAMNIKYAVAHVEECRNKGIASLKMDRVIADANWFIVAENTTISVVELKKIKDRAQESSSSGMDEIKAHNVLCPICGIESEVTVPNQEEMKDLEIEVHHRILKTTLVSLWREYEAGKLAKSSLRILVTLIQNAMEKKVPRLEEGELESKLKPPAYLACAKSFLEKLLDIIPKEYEQEARYEKLFRIFNSSVYNLVTNILILIDCYFIFNLCLYPQWPPKASVPSGILQIIDLFFYVLFLIEFVILITALGPVEYFRFKFNKLDFLCNVLIRSSEIAMIIRWYHWTEDFEFLSELHFVPISTKFLLLLRLNRAYAITKVLILYFLVLIEKRTGNTVVQFYDMGKAYLVATERNLKYLRHFVQNKVIFTRVRKELEEDRKRISRKIGMIQKERPHIAVTITTLNVIKQVINEMRDCIMEIFNEGLLDEIEKKFLYNLLSQNKKALTKMRVIKPYSSENILKHATWLQENPDMSSYLLKHARIVSYKAGDSMLNEGDEPFGIVVLAYGLVKCIYKPSKETTENRTKHGALPNFDFHVSLELGGEEEEELVVGGNIMGEIGSVTARKYDMSVICETAVQAYYIPDCYMWKAIYEIDENLRLYSQIWKTVGIREALLVFQYVSTFQGWQREKTLLYLQRSFVPVLFGMDELIINDLITDLVLFEGMVRDGNTGSIYNAPYYIPRTTKRLILPRSRKWMVEPLYETRLLIVPNEQVDESDIMASVRVPKTSLTMLLSDEQRYFTESYMASFTTASKSCSSEDCTKRTVKSIKIQSILKQDKHDSDEMDHFSTDSDIPLTKIFQTHVKKTIKRRPVARIKSRNEFKFIEDILEQSDFDEEEMQAETVVLHDYVQYYKLLRKKIEKKTKRKPRVDQSTRMSRRFTKSLKPLGDFS